MKDIGETIFIIRIKIYRVHVIDKVLRSFKMHESKKGFTPFSPSINQSKAQCPLTKDERDRIINVAYAYAVGSIMHAMIFTQSYVSYNLRTTSMYHMISAMIIGLI